MVRRLWIMLFLMLTALCAWSQTVVAPATGIDPVIASNAQTTMIYTLIAAFVPWLASIIANFTAKKDTDTPWKRFIKVLVNMLALNFTEKAGK